MQLQSITWAKAQLEWELAHKWEGLARKYKDQQYRMATKHEDQWARMAEEVDTTFQEVFSETSLTDSVRLLPRCISTTTNPGAIPMHYMGEALATTMQWRVDAPAAATVLEPEGPQAPVSTSSPVHQAGAPPLPIFSMLDIPLIGTPPVGHSLIRFIIDPLHKKQDHSPISAPDSQPGEMAHAETTEANVSSGHRTVQGTGELPEMPPEVPIEDTVASGSTEEHDSGDNTNHCGNESTQNELRENTADSDLESAFGDCLTCLNTEEVAIRTVWKRFWKKVKSLL